MKICVMGSPVDGSIFLEVSDSDVFENIFPEIEKKVGKGPLWSRFKLYSTIIGEKGPQGQAQPRLHAIRPEDTLASLEKNAKRPYAFVLRPIWAPKPNITKPIKGANSPHRTQGQLSDSFATSKAVSQSRTESSLNSKCSSSCAIPQENISGKRSFVREQVSKYGSERATKGSPRAAASRASLTSGMEPLSVPRGCETIQSGSVNDASRFEPSEVTVPLPNKSVRTLNRENEDHEDMGLIPIVPFPQVTKSLLGPIHSDSVPSIPSKKTPVKVGEARDKMVLNSKKRDQVAIRLEKPSKGEPDATRSSTEKFEEKDRPQSSITLDPSGCPSVSGSEVAEIAPMQTKASNMVSDIPVEAENNERFLTPIPINAESSFPAQEHVDKSGPKSQRLWSTLKNVVHTNPDTKGSPEKLEQTDKVTAENTSAENAMTSDVPVKNGGQVTNSAASGVCILPGKCYYTAAQRCAEDLFLKDREKLPRRYFHKWLAFRYGFASNRTVGKQRVCASTPRTQQAVQYKPLDKVEVPYAASNLSDNMEQPHEGKTHAMLPNELVCALLSVISALKRCHKNGVAEVAFKETQKSSEAFIAQWQREPDLCSVQGISKLSNAMHQAAQLLDQLANLMKLTRKQIVQLASVKKEERPAQANMRLFEYFHPLLKELGNDKCQTLQHHLDKALRREQQLRKELQRAMRGHQAIESTHTRETTHSPEADISEADRMLHVTTIEQKEAQLIRLNQALAKTRVEMERFKRYGSKLRQKEVENKELWVQLLKAQTPRRELSRASSCGWGSREATPAQGRSRSRSPLARSDSVEAQGPVFQVLRSAGRTPLRRGQGEWQEPPRVVRPRRGTPERGPAASSAVPFPTPAAPLEGSSGPPARCAPTLLPVVERGLCPNCHLAALLFLSPDTQGAPGEQAAFCRTCHQSFTFGDLAANGKGS